MKKALFLSSALVALSVVAIPVPAEADTVELRGATTLPEADLLSEGYHLFASQIEEVSGSEITTRYVGGPEAIDPFEIGAAVRRGVVDFAVTPAAYYADEVPHGLALSYSELSTDEEIESGAIDYLNEKHNELMNVEFLGRLAEVEFAFYTAVPIEEMSDFEGLRIRGTPTYRPFIEALGAQMVAMPGGEIYTALERGVVDGFGWGHVGTSDMGLHEQFQHQIEPYFYRMDVVMIVNGDTWVELDDTQREQVRAAFREAQLALPEAMEPYYEAEEARFAEQGITRVDVGPDYRELAYDAAWEWLIADQPEDGPRLEELLRK